MYTKILREQTWLEPEEVSYRWGCGCETKYDEGDEELDMCIDCLIETEKQK